MENRINLLQKGQKAMQSLQSLSAYLKQSPLEEGLLNLIYYRVSQINGCAFCLDMHSKDMLAAGEIKQRIFLLSAWRETPFYSDRERAALAWAEALTEPGGEAVSDEVYRRTREQYSEEELIDLTVAVIAINSFNRVNLAFSPEVGIYEVGAFN